MLVDPTHIAAAQGDPMPIKEFQDLDCNLATVVDAIAKLRRTELAIRRLRAAVDHDLDHFGDGAAQEKVIVRDLVHLSHPAKQLQQFPHIGLTYGEKTRNVADPRWTKFFLTSQQWSDPAPKLLVRIGESDGVL